MDASQVILQADDIHKSYEGKTGEDDLTVLQGIDLDIERGSIVSVIGSSGSGKSTLLHIIGGLDHPDSGQVRVDDQVIQNFNEEELAAFRNQKIGFVFQFHHLLPEFTALENVFMPALISEIPLEQARDRALDLLDTFGIKSRAEHRPTQLSGGEQQRVAMARALMNHPTLLLADEPTGNLDERNTDIVLDHLFSLREMENVTIVLVTHERDIAERSDIVYEITHGELNKL